MIDPATRGTLVLTRRDVPRLMSMDECIVAVEDAFLQHALDSTGTALEDVAAAHLVYRRALASDAGTSIDLGDIAMPNVTAVARQ